MYLAYKGYIAQELERVAMVWHWWWWWWDRIVSSWRASLSCLHPVSQHQPRQPQWWDRGQHLLCPANTIHCSQLYLHQQLTAYNNHEPGQWLQDKMPKLQENGGKGEGNEEKGGEAWEVLKRCDIYDSLYFCCSWSQEKASRKAAIKQFRNKLKRGWVYIIKLFRNLTFLPCFRSLYRQPSKLG